jgi:hypothetical protein
MRAAAWVVLLKFENIFIFGKHDVAYIFYDAATHDG